MRPMQAQPLSVEDIPRKAAGYLMEPKLDGMRLLLEVGPDGILKRTLTRSGRDVLPQVPHAWQHAAKPYLERFVRVTGLSWLDCEFGYQYDPGHWPYTFDFNKTMRVMGSGPVEAQRKALEHSDLPLAFAFDLPEVDDKVLWSRRDILMQDGIWEEEGPGTYWNDYVRPVPHQDRWDVDYYDSYVLAGGEGVMLKNPDGAYIYGKRPANNWYKIKKFDTFEGFIVGADPGQGKYEGLIGALIVQTMDGMEVRCSGMDDQTRIRFTARLDIMVRKQQVVEVKYFGLTAGTPRHPQFLRLRSDKTAAECLWRQT